VRNRGEPGGRGKETKILTKGRFGLSSRTRASKNVSNEDMVGKGKENRLKSRRGFKPKGRRGEKRRAKEESKTYRSLSSGPSAERYDRRKVGPKGWRVRRAVPRYLSSDLPRGEEI